MSSCSSRAQRARSCSDAASRAAPAVVGGRLRGGDGGRGAGRERLEQPLVGPAEGGHPVDRDEHAVRLAAEDERDDQAAARVHAEAAGAVLIEARAVELVGQMLRRARAHRRARDGVGQRDPLPDDAVRQLAGPRGDHEVVALAQLDQQRARRDERAPARGDQLEDGRQVGFAADGAGDLEARVEGVDGVLQLSAPRLGTGVAPRVVDGDARELGEQRSRLPRRPPRSPRRLPCRSGRGCRTARRRRAPGRRGSSSSADVRAESRRSADAARRSSAAAAPGGRSARRARRGRAGAGRSRRAPRRRVPPL